MDRAKKSLERIVRISYWEVRQVFSRGRSTRLVSIVLLFAIASVGLAFFFGVSPMEEDLYQVSVPQGTQYTEAMSDSVPIDPEVYSNASKTSLNETPVIIYRNGSAAYLPTEKSLAALSESHDAVEAYNRNQFKKEKNKSAAFPLLVSVGFVSQDGAGQENMSASQIRTNSDGNTETTNNSSAASSTKSGGSIPSNVTPPFPFKSLILAFAFIVPMNFIIQTYASTIVNERTNRSGELLLISPASKLELVAGKTIPYLAGVILSVIGISAWLGVGWESILSILSLGVAFLAGGFISGLYSRSYKELSFMVLAISVFLISFAFVPAIFTNVHSIAVISPLSIVVMQLRGESIPLLDLLFSSLPLYISGFVTFGLGLGLYKEEYLFGDFTLLSKFLETFAVRVKSWKSPFWITMILMPFVFAAELLAVAFLFVIPQWASLPIILTCVAIIEEIAKSISIYAGVRSGALEKTFKTVSLAGIMSGLGFFVAEKVTVITQTIGLMDVQTGAAAFGVNMGGLGGLTFAVLWIGIHSFTTLLSAIGTLEGKYGYIVGLIAATLAHLGYNMGVISLYA